MAEQLLKRLSGYVDEWIDEIDTGDGLQWDLGIFLHPEHGTMVYACFAIPGAILGSYINRGTALINPWAINSENLKGVFRDNQRALLNDRSRALQEGSMARTGDLFSPQFPQGLRSDD